MSGRLHQERQRAQADKKTCSALHISIVNHIGCVTGEPYMLPFPRRIPRERVYYLSLFSLLRETLFCRRLLNIYIFFDERLLLLIDCYTTTVNHLHRRVCVW